MSKEQAIPAPAKTPATASVPLETPIVRGNQTITELLLRKPGASELRGLKLLEVINMDVASLQVLLPRITMPILTSADVAGMDAPDLLQCGMEVSSFFMTRAQRA